MPKNRSSADSPSPIFVRLHQGHNWSEERSFTRTFTIGRAPDCDVVVNDASVSRRHAEIRWHDGAWHLHDLGSRNGTYVDGEKVQDTRLPISCIVKLGVGDALLSITTAQAETQLLDLPPGQDPSQKDGPKTTWYKEEHKKEMENVKRKHSLVLGVIGGVFLLVLGALAYQIITKPDFDGMKLMAEEVFYTIKRVELQVADLDERMRERATKDEQEQMLVFQQEIKKLQTKYDRSVKELGLYSKMSEQDRAIYRVARLLGECDASVPKDFVAEVHKYIDRWKKTDRLHTSMQRALAAGYTGSISNALFTRNLPPQLFYVALQESGFNDKAIGPKTRMGYAKGMWQFVPSTAKEFGLKPGPLHQEPRFDPEDERFNPKRATEAAAEYLKRIYRTDAQASGLLVIASYNWGEGNVVKMINQLPKNPKERNFWQLLNKFKIPQETYDYVFYIIAAAVIGENPQLFGFNFPAPFPSNQQL